jgi:hypothetical protein
MRRDPHLPRLTIPIRGEEGEWADIRLYNRNDEKYKLLHFAEGHGAVRFYPIEHQREFGTLFGFEGEKDMLRACEFGIQGAFAFTGGAGTVPDNFAELFKGKIVYLCYDVDDAGRKGVEKVARKIAMVAEAVHIITLPSEGLPANGDFSDWVNLGHDLAAWQAWSSRRSKSSPRPARAWSKNGTMTRKSRRSPSGTWTPSTCTASRSASSATRWARATGSSPIRCPRN